MVQKSIRKFLTYHSETAGLREEISEIHEEDKLETDGYTILRHIGTGKISEVFLAEKDGQERALKIFCPQRHLMYINWGLTGNPHPYSNPDCIKAAYWRRRMVSRLLPSIDSDFQMADAVEMSREYPGFYSEFIAHPESFEEEDMPKLRSKLTRLSEKFIDAGLPTFTFGPHHFKFGLRRARENIRHDKSNDKLILLEGEAGIPTFVPSGGIDTDYVDWTKISSFLNQNETLLRSNLGKGEYRNLEEAISKCESSTRKWYDKEDRTLMEMMSEKHINETIEALAREGKIDKNEINDLQNNLLNPRTKQILGHLAVHWGIGLAASPIPLPVGLPFRAAYTIFRRLSAEDQEEKQIHNWKVLATSCIPIPGLNWCGYLLPLKTENSNASQIMAEHYARTKKGESFHSILENSSRFSRTIKTKLFIPEERRHLYHDQKK